MKARGLQARGHDVHVLTFYGDGVFEAELAENGVGVVDLGKSGRWDVFRFGVRLLRCLRRISPDVIYSQLNGPNVLSALARPLLPRTTRLIWALLITRMEPGAYDWLYRLFSRLERRLARVPDLILSNSEAARLEAISEGIEANRIRVLPNGIDTDRFRPDSDGRAAKRQEWGIGESEIIVGMVGRFDPMKGHACFLEAAAQIAVRRRHARFVCAGVTEKRDLDTLRKLADRMGIVDRLVCVPESVELAATYSAFDVFCLPSRYGEGLPNVILEALACGLPCVVTDVGDAGRVVKPVGTVVPPGNAASIAEACDALIGLDPAERSAIGRRGREHVENNYSESRLVSGLESVMQECIEGRRGIERPQATAA